MQASDESGCLGNIAVDIPKSQVDDPTAIVPDHHLLADTGVHRHYLAIGKALHDDIGHRQVTRRRHPEIVERLEPGILLLRMRSRDKPTQQGL